MNAVLSAGPAPSAPVTLERDGALAVVSISNPPVNALNQATRSALLDLVVTADNDPTVEAIVVFGHGRHFVAGADIREFDAASGTPLLNDVLLRVEACTKPVVAALHGSVFGGGLELALACHYRAASSDTRFAFPEVKLGLMPGSGGTQRFPRLVGPRTALEWMLGGDTFGRAPAAALGLVDHLLEGSDTLGAAKVYARELIVLRAAPKRLRDKTVERKGITPSFFAEERQRGLTVPGLIAPELINRCVEASLYLPFDEGLAFSRTCFEQCRASIASTALRRLFLAERGDGGGSRSAQSIQWVAVVGAGTMGTGIAFSFANAGLNVALIDSNSAALDAGMNRISSIIAGQRDKQRLSEAEAVAIQGRVIAAASLDKARDVDLVVEAVFEDLALKQRLLSDLDTLCRPGTILASNTSTLDVDALAGATRRPQHVLGMHFFSPAHVMRLVEIVRGKATSDGTVACVRAIAKRLNRIGVVVGNTFGFVGNRMLYAYGRENQSMLLEGAAPSRIDGVLQQFGMAMGPNAVGDLAGLDVGYRARRERKDIPSDPTYYRVADMLVEGGRLGQKTGKGIYLYADGARTPTADPDVDEMIRSEAVRLNITRREIPDQEIEERCIFALINEGARLLEAGVARSAADIDVIWCNGYGFPRSRGGPMFYADTIGLPRVLGTIQRFAIDRGTAVWAPAPLLVRLAAERRTFDSWRPTHSEGADGNTNTDKGEA